MCRAWIQLYGCETCNGTRDEALEMCVGRSMKKTKWIDRVRDEEVIIRVDENSRLLNAVQKRQETEKDVLWERKNVDDTVKVEKGRKRKKLKMTSKEVKIKNKQWTNLEQEQSLKTIDVW